MNSNSKKQVATALLKAASALEEINAYGWYRRKRSPEERKEAARKAAETRKKRQIRVDLIINGKKLAGVIPVYSSKPSEDYISVSKASLKKLANLEMERNYRYTDDYAWDNADNFGKGARATLGQLLTKSDRDTRTYFTKGRDGKWELRLSFHSNESWSSAEPLRIQIKKKEAPAEIDFGGLAAKVLKASKTLELISGGASKYDDPEFAGWIYNYLKKDHASTLDSMKRRGKDPSSYDPAMIFLGSLAMNIEDAYRKEHGMSFSDYHNSEYPKKLKRNLELAFDKLHGRGSFKRAIQNNKKTKVRSSKEEVVEAGSMRRVTKVPEDADLMTQRFFETLLKKKLQIGYDEDSQEGKIALKEFGDLGFSLASNDPAVWIWLGLRQESVKLDLGLAEEAILLLVDTMEKVRHMS